MYLIFPFPKKWKEELLKWKNKKIQIGFTMGSTGMPYSDKTMIADLTAKNLKKGV